MATYGEIIYCKDCDYCMTTYPVSHPGTEILNCRLWRYKEDGYYMVNPHDYCSRAKYKGVKEDERSDKL